MREAFQPHIGCARMRTRRAASVSPSSCLKHTILENYVRSFVYIGPRQMYNPVGDDARMIMSTVEGFGNWLNNLVISVRSVLHGATDCGVCLHHNDEVHSTIYEEQLVWNTVCDKGRIRIASKHQLCKCPRAVP